MLTFATDSARAFHPNAVIGDANGGLLDELAFANLGFEPIKRRTGFVLVTELPAREVLVVEHEEPERDNTPDFVEIPDRYTAMADNLGLSEQQWDEIVDDADNEHYTNQECYYSRTWEVEARHDEIVEAFDRDLYEAKAANRLKTKLCWRLGHARRGKGDGRRSRRAVPTHDVFALPTPTLKELSDAVEHDMLDAEREAHEEDYQFDLEYYLIKYERWLETRPTDCGRKLLLWMLDEQWRHDDYHLYEQSHMEAEYVRWARKVNMPYNPEATIVFDDWLHRRAECTGSCLQCAHEQAQADRHYEEELYWEASDRHEFGRCDPYVCQFCAQERAEFKRRQLQSDHERGLCCYRNCSYCEQERREELEAEAYEHRIELERMQAIDTRERTLDELQERFDAALRRACRKVFKAKGGHKRSERGFSDNKVHSWIEDYHIGKARRGVERAYHGRQWQRHKPRHKPTVPAWVQFEPAIYEDDFLVAA